MNAENSPMAPIAMKSSGSKTVLIIPMLRYGVMIRKKLNISVTKAGIGSRSWGVVNYIIQDTAKQIPMSFFPMGSINATATKYTDHIMMHGNIGKTVNTAALTAIASKIPYVQTV